MHLFQQNIEPRINIKLLYSPIAKEQYILKIIYRNPNIFKKENVP